MFENIIGQEKIKGLLSRAISDGKTSHAYIIEGDEGMGKKSLACAFGLYLVCKEGTACGKCSACMLARAGTHPDITLAKPDDDKKSIGVDNIREIISQASLKPCISDKKVIIFSDDYDLTPAAQNALLKVLEEPPSYVVFLILIKNSNLLLETVRSRSVLLRLTPYTQAQVRAALPALSQSDFESVYAYAGGNIGKAKKLAGDDEFAALRRDVTDTLLKIAPSGRDAVLAMASFMETHKDDAEVVLSVMLGLLRDALMMCLGCDALCKNADVTDRLRVFAQAVDAKKTLRATELVIKYKRMMDSNVNYPLLVTSFSDKIWEVLNG